MIHDARVEITCDGCHCSAWFEPEYRYTSYSGENGYYDTSDEATEAFLEGEDWIVDGDKHYCCKECAE